MGKYLEINLVLLKEVLCFLFRHGEMYWANVFSGLSPSFMGLACSSHRVKLFIRNELDNHTTLIL